jgi:hypothetical protein
MRCPDCKHQQKYKDGTRCAKCGYAFTLRKKTDGLSDYALRQIMLRLTGNEQHCFTRIQLLLEICRYWRKQNTALTVVAVVIAMILGGVIWGITEWKLWISLALMGVLIGAALLLRRKQARSLPLKKAGDLLKKYRDAHPIPGLADGRAFIGRSAEVADQDFYYAPERILVVERDDLADALIRNRFHLSAKTVVVSRTGYPAPIFAACQGFLARHPATPVQVLHDASLSGFSLSAQLATDPDWQFARDRLVDLGLSRSTLHDKTRLPWLPRSATDNGMLSSNHDAMLRAGRRVPVDCVPPKPLLNLLATAVIAGSLALPLDKAGDTDFDVEADYG